MSEERGTTAVPTDEPEGDPTPAADPRPATFRGVPTVSLVAIAFLALCLSPIAFQGGAWFLLFAIPAAAAVWVVRTRTRVDTAGLHVRGLVRTRSMDWADVATLRLAERGWVHAVPQEGADLVLRGVRIRDLGRVGEASGGRISAPSPAEAEAAAEHARELEATRMRIARLRERQEAQAQEDTESVEDTPPPESGDAAPGTAHAARADDQTADDQTADDQTADDQTADDQTADDQAADDEGSTGRS